jgi:hypothetical protein
MLLSLIHHVRRGHFIFLSLDVPLYLSDGVRAGAKRLGRKKELDPSKVAEMLEHLHLPHSYVLQLRIGFPRYIVYLVMHNLTFLQPNLMNFHILPMTSYCSPVIF